MPSNGNCQGRIATPSLSGSIGTLRGGPGRRPTEDGPLTRTANAYSAPLVTASRSRSWRSIQKEMSSSMMERLSAAAR